MATAKIAAGPHSYLNQTEQNRGGQHVNNTCLCVHRPEQGVKEDDNRITRHGYHHNLFSGFTLDWLGVAPELPPGYYLILVSCLCLVSLLPCGRGCVDVYVYRLLLHMETGGIQRAQDSPSSLDLSGRNLFPLCRASTVTAGWLSSEREGMERTFSNASLAVCSFCLADSASASSACSCST